MSNYQTITGNRYGITVQDPKAGITLVPESRDVVTITKQGYDLLVQDHHELQRLQAQIRRDKQEQEILRKSMQEKEATPLSFSPFDIVKVFIDLRNFSVMAIILCFNYYVIQHWTPFIESTHLVLKSVLITVVANLTIFLVSSLFSIIFFSVLETRYNIIKDKRPKWLIIFEDILIRIYIYFNRRNIQEHD